MGNNVCCQNVCSRDAAEATEQNVDTIGTIAVRIKEIEAGLEADRFEYTKYVKELDAATPSSPSSRMHAGDLKHTAKRNPNGTMYEGQVRDGVKQGHGRYKYVEPPGSYEGQWADNRAHGLGHFKDAAGEYKGYWMSGEKHGLGMEIWFDDSTIFRGMYVSGVKQGDGIYQWSDGSAYEGQLRDNVICGHGRLTDEEGVYVGEFVDNAQHGYGRWDYANGDFYEGQFQDSLRHGDGTLSWTQENKQYRGQWRNGVPHGKGLVTVRGVVKNAYYLNGKTCTREAFEKSSTVVPGA
ncbi:unnamed protein product [Amoebophrya sp. A25]|nr:unnamed protein product [Amoebophrya sp. A25]|eukprot:GSA25T00008511001.1